QTQARRIRPWVALLQLGSKNTSFVKCRCQRFHQPDTRVGRTIGLLLRSFQFSDQRTADDDTVGNLAQFLHLLRLADAEADAQRQVGHRPQLAQLLAEGLRQPVALASNADDAYTIKEACAKLDDLFGPRWRRRRRDQQDQLEVLGLGE